MAVCERSIFSDCLRSCKPPQHQTIALSEHSLPLHNWCRTFPHHNNSPPTLFAFGMTTIYSLAEFNATRQLSPPFTCLGEIPMQPPILYSMSSSGEVTLALQGLQSTFLQNCILVAQPPPRRRGGEIFQNVRVLWRADALPWHCRWCIRDILSSHRSVKKIIHIT